MSCRADLVPSIDQFKLNYQLYSGVSSWHLPSSPSIRHLDTPSNVVLSRLVMFLRSVTKIQEKEATRRWSMTFTEHQAAMTKVCGLLFLVQISCWTPYAVLCLWTIVLPPETLNVYYTLLPSICCKLSPILNAMVIWWNVPRITAGFFYLKRGRKGRMPSELFDYR